MHSKAQRGERVYIFSGIERRTMWSEQKNKEAEGNEAQETAKGSPSRAWTAMEELSLFYRYRKAP